MFLTSRLQSEVGEAGSVLGKQSQGVFHDPVDVLKQREKLLGEKKSKKRKWVIW